MRVVVQKVNKASVTISNKQVASISKGLLLLVGIVLGDTEEDIDWLCQKMVKLRIFQDDEGKMNLSVQDIVGDVLVVSQFTLHAQIKKGNRPSYVKAAKSEVAIPLYELFKERLSFYLGKEIQSGEFGANMQVELINDGPVTLLMDSKNRE
ncbi:D-aminoacyl-tRNA deacylase [Wenyingzhuangia sp. IMCC45533]